jgi:hypothetical protein
MNGSIGEVVFINGAAKIHVAWPGEPETAAKERPSYAAGELTVVGQRE